MGYSGAVAINAGSAPVGVPPAYPTLVGNSEGSRLVGDGGGNAWISVLPALGSASKASTALLLLLLGLLTPKQEGPQKAY